MIGPTAGALVGACVLLGAVAYAVTALVGHLLAVVVEWRLDR